jgi:hypothetical protein
MATGSAARCGPGRVPDDPGLAAGAGALGRGAGAISSGACTPRHVGGWAVGIWPAGEESLAAGVAGAGGVATASECGLAGTGCDVRVAGGGLLGDQGGVLGLAPVCSPLGLVSGVAGAAGQVAEPNSRLTAAAQIAADRAARRMALVRPAACTS